MERAHFALIFPAIFAQKENNVTLFTSPHLFDYRERVRVNGKPISQNRLEELLSPIRSYDDLNGRSLTFFEVGFIASASNQ